MWNMCEIWIIECISYRFGRISIRLIIIFTGLIFVPPIILLLLADLVVSSPWIPHLQFCDGAGVLVEARKFLWLTQVTQVGFIKILGILKLPNSLNYLWLWLMPSLMVLAALHLILNSQVGEVIRKKKLCSILCGTEIFYSCLVFC